MESKTSYIESKEDVLRLLDDYKMLINSILTKHLSYEYLRQLEEVMERLEDENTTRD